ncbi:hypothetical protein [Tianweitania sediminis]|uniref:Uncharacterized protein n=1 Tax=Tianweitania sediminis TaxID=1502156 RepID=A0A8J7UMR3_9HYPH|nr:hypothetical protein [Tianweitania sediminis]MBP0440647.1 hypothetical protein [Tianweitania sediminis]
MTLLIGLIIYVILAYAVLTWCLLRAVGGLFPPRAPLPRRHIATGEVIR